MGRVESMRDPNSQKVSDSKVPVKSEYSVDILKTGSAKSSRPLSATSTASDKLHAIEMAINSESVTQNAVNLEAGDASVSEKPRKPEKVENFTAPVSIASVTIAPNPESLFPTSVQPNVPPNVPPNGPQRVSNLNIATIAPSPQMVQRAETVQNQVANLSPQQQQRLNELARAMEGIVAEINQSRIDKNRPDTHERMTRQELLDEKQELQKLLLHFEEEYSRPNQSHEKNVVRVVYDMYRNVKRHLSVQNPVQNPGQNPVQNPLQNPVHNPVQNPVQNPVPNPGSKLRMANSDTRNSTSHSNQNQHSSNFVTPMVSNNNSAVPSRQVSVMSRPINSSSRNNNNRLGSSSQRAVDEVLNTLRNKTLDELKSLLRISEQEHSRMQSRATQINQDIAKMFSSYQNLHGSMPTEQVLCKVLKRFRSCLELYCWNFMLRILF